MSEIKEKMITKKEVGAILIFVVLSAFALMLFFSLWLFIFLLAIVFVLIFISYFGDLSIPFLSQFLKREYLIIRFKIKDAARSEKAGRLRILKLYSRLIYFLIILFKNAQDSFDVITDEAEEIYEKVIMELESDEEKIIALFNEHKRRHQQIKTFSLMGILLMICSVLIVSFILRLMPLKIIR